MSRAAALLGVGVTLVILTVFALTVPAFDLTTSVGVVGTALILIGARQILRGDRR